MVDSNEYNNECKIEGHGYPISFNNLRILDKKSENSMCKVKGLMFDNTDGEYKESKGSGFFFKQNISKINYYNKYFLITNNHVIDSYFLNNNDKLIIIYKNEEKEIPLND